MNQEISFEITEEDYNASMTDEEWKELCEWVDNVYIPKIKRENKLKQIKNEIYEAYSLITQLTVKLALFFPIHTSIIPNHEQKILLNILTDLENAKIKMNDFKKLIE